MATIGSIATTSSLLINESVGKLGGTTVSQVMRGCRHRSKLAKNGVVAGLIGNLAMWSAISAAADGMDRRAIARYARQVVVLDPRWPGTKPSRFAPAGLSVLSVLAALLKSADPLLASRGRRDPGQPM